MTEHQTHSAEQKQPADEKPKRHRLWVIVGSVTAGIVFIVGAVTTFLPLIMGMFADPTGADSLATGADVLSGATEPGAAPTSAALALDDAPIVGEMFTGETPPGKAIWFVPIDAPIETFPAEGWTFEFGCGDAQVAWLTEHAYNGRVAGGGLGVYVRNTATEGASMSLDNVRLEGTWSPGAPTVPLQCGPGVGGDPTQFGILQRTGPGVWGEDPFIEYGYGEQVGALEGSPLTVNLAPGEIGILELQLPRAEEHFEGVMVADMITPEERVVVLATDLTFYPQTVPGFRLDLGNFEGVLTCETIDVDSWSTISVAPCAGPGATDFLRVAATNL